MDNKGDDTDTVRLLGHEWDYDSGRKSKHNLNLSDLKEQPYKMVLLIINTNFGMG